MTKNITCNNTRPSRARSCLILAVRNPSIESIFGKRAEGHHFKCGACCNETALCNRNMSCKGNASAGVTLPKDCSELVVPNHPNGSYTIYPYGVQHRPVSVYCAFDRDGPWTVIQRRVDGSVLFYRNWDAYKKFSVTPTVTTGWVMTSFMR